MRVGQGFDAHRFQDGNAVVLGGVTIPFDKSLAAHSDGDVLLHAICDALLGAAALGDIGRHFPDSNDEYKGADSRDLLREVVRLVRDAGYTIDNIDATLIAERPKISAHVEAMRDNLAADAENGQMVETPPCSLTSCRAGRSAWGRTVEVGKFESSKVFILLAFID